MPSLSRSARSSSTLNACRSRWTTAGSTLGRLLEVTQELVVAVDAAGVRRRQQRRPAGCFVALLVGHVEPQDPGAGRGQFVDVLLHLGELELVDTRIAEAPPLVVAGHLAPGGVGGPVATTTTSGAKSWRSFGHWAIAVSQSVRSLGSSSDRKRRSRHASPGSRCGRWRKRRRCPGAAGPSRRGRWRSTCRSSRPRRRRAAVSARCRPRPADRQEPWRCRLLRKARHLAQRLLGDAVGAIGPDEGGAERRRLPPRDQDRR